jgi:glutamyl-tRNA(Gln) amidotransferase subunit E
MEKIINELKVKPSWLGVFLGLKLKFAEGHYEQGKTFNRSVLFPLFKFLKEEKYHPQLAERMLPELIRHPQMEFASILTVIKFRRYSKKEILSKIPILIEKFKEGKKETDPKAMKDWVMGQLRTIALGNMDLTELSKEISKF